MKRILISAKERKPIHIKPEQRPNELCSCGSKKKAKKCCLYTKKISIQKKIVELNSGY